MRIVIGNESYSMNHGIGLLKTLHGDKYENIPNSFKHEELKAEWDKYNGVPTKLYQMSKSKDTETLILCSKLLDESNVVYFKDYKTVWSMSKTEEVLNEIVLFLTKNQERRNNFK